MQHAHTTYRDLHAHLHLFTGLAALIAQHPELPVRLLSQPQQTCFDALIKRCGCSLNFSYMFIVLTLWGLCGLILLRGMPVFVRREFNS